MRAVRITSAALAILVLAGALTWIAASTGLPRVEGLARTAPTRTSWMRARAAEAARRGRAYRVDQRWTRYERISPLLRRAVLIAEDDAFFAHGGLDWNEIRAAARENWKRKRIVRGGSTITQQLAKNLYLGEERTALRKLRELLIARRLEEKLTKRRIFELYLNLIEWGDGIYGIEAAARRHFGVPASDLTARQAALLAAVIVNPRRYSPVAPSRRIEKRARTILGRMWRRGYLTEAEYRIARGDAPPARSPLEWLFGPPAPSPTDTADSAATDTTTTPVDSVTTDGDGEVLGDRP
jgi:monofunctional biosynthetic peptidoglycan transglycosylase